MEKAKEHRCGVVGLVGRPNVGKSTLLNRLVGSKIAIVTPKPQTTRDNILGIATTKDYQILFFDTPGIHEPKRALNRRMVAQAKDAIRDCDLVTAITDVDDAGRIIADEMVLDALRAQGKPAILAINKIDLIQKSRLLPIIGAYHATGLFHAVVPISALSGDGVERLVGEIVSRLPVGPALYPDDQLSDRPLRFLAQEVIREKVILCTKQELPYCTAVIIDGFEEDDKIVKLKATIFCERPSQKGILIGSKGRMLKKIGTLAREEIEHLLEKKVFLELFVKVDRDWTKNERGLKRAKY
jgi:GTP-binding protein Era